MISVVTPWLEHPEYIEGYGELTAGCELIIVDTGSTRENRKALEAFGGPLCRVLTWHKDFDYAKVCNFGMRHAHGSVLVVLNNDVRGPAFAEAVERDVKDGGLYGPSLQAQMVQGVPVPYLEGWCVAATRETWDHIGGWNEDYRRGYWEDNELSLRAVVKGAKLHKVDWPIQHLNNGTSRDKPDMHSCVGANSERFRAYAAEVFDQGLLP